MYCSTCGKQIPESSVFCGYCGARVESASTTTPVAPAKVGAPWWLTGALAFLVIALLGLLLSERASKPAVIEVTREVVLEVEGEAVEVTRLVFDSVEVTRLVPEAVREVTRVVVEPVYIEDEPVEVTRVVTESVEVTRVVTATPTR